VGIPRANAPETREKAGYVNSYRILLIGDVALPTGFGRILQRIGLHLHRAGHTVAGICLQYDGLLPHTLPFHVAGVNGRDVWQAIGGIVNTFQPNIIISGQDLPYHVTLRHLPSIDWSTIAHIVLTPVDGVPINNEWIKGIAGADGLLTISEFGVEGFRKQGKTAVLCPPGVDLNEFNRLPDEKRAELRGKVGIPADAFVVGMFAMNQGRKDFSGAIEGFAKAFPDVPNTYLWLDCEEVSPGGWDIVNWLLVPNGVPLERVRFRKDGTRQGLSLNDRYNLLDTHMVISHREGFGLPLIESMAMHIPSVAIDYCSGPEIVGRNSERGALIKAAPGRLGTWGGARDFNADTNDLATQLRTLYDHPIERMARGEAAYTWVKDTRSWDRTDAAVDDMIRQIAEARGADFGKTSAQPAPVNGAGPFPKTPAGMTVVIQNLTVNTPDAQTFAADIPKIIEAVGHGQTESEGAA